MHDSSRIGSQGKPPLCSLLFSFRAFSRRSSISDTSQLLLRMIGSRKWSVSLENEIVKTHSPISPTIVDEVLTSIFEPKVALRFFLFVSKQPGYVQTVENKHHISSLWSHTKHFYAFLDISDQFQRGFCHMTNSRFTVLIMGYARAGMVEEAVLALEKMKSYDCQPDLIHFNCVLDALAKADEIDATQAMYTRMLRAGILPNVVTYTIMILGLAKANKVEAACTQFNKMIEEGCEPDLKAFTALLSSLCKARQSNRALKHFEAMERKGFIPDVPVYNALIQTLSQQGMLSEARRVLSSMEQAGLEPSSLTLSMVVGRHLKGREPEISNQSLVHKLKKVGLADAPGYPAIIYSTCKSGQVDEIESTIMQLKQSSCVFTLDMFNAVIESLCRESLAEEAQFVIFAMEKVGLSPDRVTYTMLISCFCHLKRITDARKVLVTMLAKGCRPDTVCFNTLLRGICDSGDFAIADDLIDEMMLAGCTPNMVTYNVYINGLCKGGKVSEALQYIEKVRKLGYVPNNRTLIVLLTALCDESDFATAQELFQRSISEYGMVPDAVCYDLMVRRFSDANKVNMAEQLFNEMINQGFQPRVFICNSLLNCYCRNQLLLKASDLFKSMVKRGCVPNLCTRRILDTAFRGMKPPLSNCRLKT